MAFSNYSADVYTERQPDYRSLDRFVYWLLKDMAEVDDDTILNSKTYIDYSVSSSLTILEDQGQQYDLLLAFAPVYTSPNTIDYNLISGGDDQSITIAYQLYLSMLYRESKDKIKDLSSKVIRNLTQNESKVTMHIPNDNLFQSPSTMATQVVTINKVGDYVFYFNNGTGTITSSNGTGQADNHGAVSVGYSNKRVITVNQTGTFNFTIAGDVRNGYLEEKNEYYCCLDQNRLSQQPTIMIDYEDPLKRNYHTSTFEIRFNIFKQT